MDFSLINLRRSIQSFARIARRQNSVVHALVNATQTKAVSFTLNQVTTILLVRYLSKADFGTITIFSSIFAVAELGIQIFDSAITRFYPTLHRGPRVFLVSTVVWLKIGLTIIAIFSLFLLAPYLAPPGDLAQYSMAIYLNVANLILSAPRDSFEKTLNAQFKYKWMFGLSIISSLNGLIGVSLLQLFHGSWQHFFIYKLTETVIILAVSTHLIWQSEKLILVVLLKKFRWKLFSRTYTGYIHSYCLPLCAASISTYIKNYAPSFVVGSVAGMDALGTANVLTNLVRTFHKGTQDIFDRISPALFKRQGKNPSEFEKIYTSYFVRGLALRCGIILAFTAFSPLIFKLYAIEFNRTYLIMFELLLAEFGLVYFHSASNYLIMSKTNTMPLLWASLSRNIIGFILTIWLIGSYGVIGLPVGFLMGLFFSVLSYIRHVNEFVLFHTKLVSSLMFFTLFTLLQFLILYAIYI